MPDEEASTHKADPLLTQHAIEHLEDQWRSGDEPTSITRKGHYQGFTVLTERRCRNATAEFSQGRTGSESFQLPTHLD